MEVIDVPAPPPAIDVEITDFRAKYDEALMSRAHPEHNVRSGQLSALFERKFSGDEALPVLASKPDVDQVGGNQPADDLARLAEPAQKPSDYDFSKLADKVPVGMDVQEDTQLENYAREWLLSGEVSPAEGSALASVYAESLSWSPVEVARMGETTLRDIRVKYGPDAPAIGTAAMRVAEETPGLSDFLNSSGLLNHPRVVAKLIHAAEKRGYFKKGA